MKESTTRRVVMLSAAFYLSTIKSLAFGLQRNHVRNTTYKPSSYKLFSQYAVATDTKVCSRIGRDIIEMNGSVVDSAIASMFCVGVINSHSNGIGGGHVAIIYARPKNGNKKVMTTLIARERAPSGASETMFVNRSSLYGGLAVAIPGEIKGFHEAWERFGWLPWRKLVEPTIRLLEGGYKVERDNADFMNRTKSTILNTSLVKSPLLRNTFFRDGIPLNVGVKVVDPKLAETFKKIANDPEDFYKGDLAKLIAKEIQDEGGIVSETDLANYVTEWKEPLTFNLNGNNSRLYTLRPPASGAVLGLILNILKHYNFSRSSIDENSKILTFHRIVEAFKFAYAGRLQLGDENFVKVAELVSLMTSDEFARKLWENIDDFRTHPVDNYGAMYAPTSEFGTSHLSILHPDGSAIAMTSTINTIFGSMIKGPQTGIIYNNEMDDFSSPNQINISGYTPSPSNYIVPGKRPMSSMSPLLILDEQDNVRIISGASGGSRIITITAWVIINSLWFNFTLGEATDFLRLHNQLLPDKIFYERGSEKIILDGLAKKGHKIKLNGKIIGASQTIRNWCQTIMDKWCIEAASDGRKFGRPWGA